MALPDLPPAFGATRHALHGLAEHVLSAAYFHATKHIGLRPAPRGFGTPVFGDRARIRVDGVSVVHERAGGDQQTELTTLRAAAAFVGVPLGAPPVYTATTTPDPDQPLAVDRDAALALGDWYALGSALLHDLRAEYLDTSTEAQLWPEHFDLACEIGDEASDTKAAFGASPGDDVIPQPYLYVAPWVATRKTGILGAYPFGGAVTYAELQSAGEAGTAGRQFFGAAAALLMNP